MSITKQHIEVCFYVKKLGGEIFSQYFISRCSNAESCTSSALIGKLWSQIRLFLQSGFAAIYHKSMFSRWCWCHCVRAGVAWIWLEEITSSWSICIGRLRTPQIIPWQIHWNIEAEFKEIMVQTFRRFLLKVENLNFPNLFSDLLADFSTRASSIFDWTFVRNISARCSTLGQKSYWSAGPTTFESWSSHSKVAGLTL